ncbi:MAG: helix-turn-helix transcriptional regulator [Deltaproteobacteria bacterium]|nr:helix-turn-helix transcriptional regulator [Deltaproteobacteria bacterium]
MKMVKKPDMRIVGARIRLQRNLRGKTLTQLAGDANLGLNTLSSIEHGAISLGPTRAARVAAALGVDVEVLLAP